MKKIFYLVSIFLLMFSSVYAQDNIMYKSWGAERMNVREFIQNLNEETKQREVVVAVIDSGIDIGHERFDGRIKEAGYDFINNNSTPNDKTGHGTHVAGIIADLTQGTNIKIIPIKITEDNSTLKHEKIAEGIEYAINKKADIINLSLSWWSGKEEEQIVINAIKKAIDNDVLVVNASGNGFISFEEMSLLEDEPIGEDIVFVGAISNGTYSTMDERVVGLDMKPDFSNYGELVDIMAPGVNILSSITNSCRVELEREDLGYSKDELFSEFEKGYGVMDGTSMATPHISAILALYKMAYPELSNTQLVSLMKVNADEINDAIIYGGTGVPNMSRAICSNTNGVHNFTNEKCSQCGLIIKEESREEIISEIKCNECDSDVSCRKTEAMHIYVCVNNESHIIKVGNHDVENGICKECGYQIKKSYNNNFEDISSNHWGYRDIGYMWEKGIVKGYHNPENNKYYLYDTQPITAEAFISLVARVLGYTNQAESENSIYMPSGIKDRWSIGEWKYLMHYLSDSEVEIKRILSNNSRNGSDAEIMENYKANITRERAAYLMGLFIDNRNVNQENSFEDWNNVTEQYKENLASLVSCELLKGSDNKVRPKDTITRAEAVTLISRMYALKEAGLLY